MMNMIQPIAIKPQVAPMSAKAPQSVSQSQSDVSFSGTQKQNSSPQVNSQQLLQALIASTLVGLGACDKTSMDNAERSMPVQQTAPTEQVTSAEELAKQLQQAYENDPRGYLNLHGKEPNHTFFKATPGVDLAAANDAGCPYRIRNEVAETSRDFTPNPESPLTPACQEYLTYFNPDNMSMDSPYERIDMLDRMLHTRDDSLPPAMDHLSAYIWMSDIVQEDIKALTTPHQALYESATEGKEILPRELATFVVLAAENNQMQDGNIFGNEEYLNNVANLLEKAYQHQKDNYKEEERIHGKDFAEEQRFGAAAAGVAQALNMDFSPENVAAKQEASLNGQSVVFPYLYEEGTDASRFGNLVRSSYDITPFQVKDILLDPTIPGPMEIFEEIEGVSN